MIFKTTTMKPGKEIKEKRGREGRKERKTRKAGKGSGEGAGEECRVSEGSRVEVQDYFQIYIGPT